MLKIILPCALENMSVWTAKFLTIGSTSKIAWELKRETDISYFQKNKSVRRH